MPNSTIQGDGLSPRAAMPRTDALKADATAAVDEAKDVASKVVDEAKAQGAHLADQAKAQRLVLERLVAEIQKDVTSWP